MHSTTPFYIILVLYATMNDGCGNMRMPQPNDDDPIAQYAMYKQDLDLAVQAIRSGKANILHGKYYSIPESLSNIVGGITCVDNVVYLHKNGGFAGDAYSYFINVIDEQKDIESLCRNNKVHIMKKLGDKWYYILMN